MTVDIKIINKPINIEYITLKESIKRNGLRHMANGDRYMSEGKEEYAKGSYRKANNNFKRVNDIEIHLPHLKDWL